MFIVNVQGALYREDKWLVIERSAKEKHAGGTLAFVGGKVDREGVALNILEKTVRRELMEEVGVEIGDNLHYLQSSSFVTASGTHVVNIVFVCEHKRGEPYCKSKDEVENVYWMTCEEAILHPKCPPWTKEDIVRAENVRLMLIRQQ
ncbi:NUDIX domain-containing protein [Paenibacillus hamazuiensis]|uniref:NUDIX domain-containing protein n=1 Tax=Paenibacillus hamazuiensis TaxID=2936508 RepID=UPI0020106879|nr:NUDIX domain-containing protein [Paenibacillus hamazuiensis]